MPSLAKVPPRHTAPPELPALPDECPRCDASLEHGLREVNLALTLDDGAEAEVTGFECAACGWVCAPQL